MNYLPEYSSFTKGVDFAFLFIIGISLFFLIGLTITMIVFVIKYNKKRHPKPVQIKENMMLEVAWTVIPLILVLLMFYYGYVAFIPMRDVPKDAMVVKTTGYMWDWDFEYPNGKVSKDLYVPLNKAVKLEMNSTDVLHSFYIPAFRVKEDVVPGKETFMWFSAKELGTYEIFCAEYCGLQHSFMDAKVIVMQEDDFKKWMKDYVKPKVNNAEGLAIMKKNACMGCHSVDGSKLVGPSFKGLAGSKRTVIQGDKTITITADDNYLLNSIINPNAHVVEGYSANLMQSYKGVIKEEDLKKMIEYIKTIK